MRFLFIPQLVLFFCLSMVGAVVAQSPSDVVLIPKPILDNTLRIADRVDIVHGADATVNWTFTDSTTIATLLGFMLLEYPGNDMGCNRLAKMYFSSNSDVILEVDVHYFGHSKCGYFVFRENDIPVYFAYMGIGGLSLCEQLVNLAGYPRF